MTDISSHPESIVPRQPILSNQQDATEVLPVAFVTNETDACTDISSQFVATDGDHQLADYQSETTILAEAISSETLKRPFQQRLASSFATFFKEWWGEGDLKHGWRERTKQTGAVAVAGATQAADRGRALVWLLPASFDKATRYAIEHGYNGYEQATLSGVAVGGLFMVYGYAIGKIAHKSINSFPETTEAVTTNHPAMISVVSKAAGVRPSKDELVITVPIKPDEGYEVGTYDSRKSLLGKIGLGISRGLKTGFLYGTTMQVGMAKVNEHSNHSIEKRIRVTAAEGAAVLGSTALGVSVLLVHNPAMAETVRDAITDKQNLFGASVTLIALSTVLNYFSRRKKMKQSDSQISENEQETSDLNLVTLESNA